MGTSDNVVRLRGLITKLDLPVAQILDGAAEHDLQSIVLMGYRQDGTEYFASTIADGGEVLWLMERLKKRLLEIEVP
tara:strand:+ start:3216 stop:3446 length:231 start_codon:yes stop_codon:yes gene_type:complete